MSKEEMARNVEEEIMDSASRQCTSSQHPYLKQFLANKCIPVLQHPLYSPDLAPCDFHLFPKVKSAVKRTHFQPVDEVKSKTADLPHRVSADDLQHCFEQWKICMQWCTDGGGGSTLKGIEISL
jgi:hypothetical protein